MVKNECLNGIENEMRRFKQCMNAGSIFLQKNFNPTHIGYKGGSWNYYVGLVRYPALFFFLITPLANDLKLISSVQCRAV